MARAIRWVRDHRPEDLLLNGLLTVAILGALAVGYWAWRADSQAASPVVAGRVLLAHPAAIEAGGHPGFALEGDAEQGGVREAALARDLEQCRVGRLEQGLGDIDVGPADLVVDGPIELGTEAPFEALTAAADGVRDHGHRDASLRVRSNPAHGLRHEWVADGEHIGRAPGHHGDRRAEHAGALDGLARERALDE